LLLAVCDQTAAQANNPPHHLANTDCQRELLSCVYSPDCECFLFISE
jgi:hypothetical protein